jgi:hypothetical protein
MTATGMHGGIVTMTVETATKLTSELPHFISKFPNLSRLILSLRAQLAPPEIQQQLSRQIAANPHQPTRLCDLALGGMAISVPRIRSIAEDLQVSCTKALLAGKSRRSHARLSLLDICLMGDLELVRSFLDIVLVEFKPSLEELSRSREVASRFDSP